MRAYAHADRGRSISLLPLRPFTCGSPRPGPAWDGLCAPDARLDVSQHLTGRGSCRLDRWPAPERANRTHQGLLGRGQPAHVFPRAQGVDSPSRRRRFRAAILLGIVDDDRACRAVLNWPDRLRPTNRPTGAGAGRAPSLPGLVFSGGLRLRTALHPEQPGHAGAAACASTEPLVRLDALWTGGRRRVLYPSHDPLDDRCPPGADRMGGQAPIEADVGTARPGNLG